MSKTQLRAEKRKQKELKPNRIWEIDFLRVLALVLMVFFHLVYDLNQFVGLEIVYLSGFWYWEGKMAALLFIFLAGISSGLSRNNAQRGLKVLGFALIITLFTYFILREEYVRFGILHFLAVAMWLFPLLKRLPNMLLYLGAAAIVLVTIPLRHIFVETSLLLPFGVIYKGFTSVDYYPLFPYLAAFMLGVLVYKNFYVQGQSLFPAWTPGNGHGLWKYLTVVSKNSLLIYLLHQPLMLALIFLLKWLFQA